LKLLTSELLAVKWSKNNGSDNGFLNYFSVGSCGPWGSFGSCSKSCGSGFKVRRRSCPGDSLHLKQQKTTCNTNLCPGQSMEYLGGLLLIYVKESSKYFLKIP